MHSRPTVASWMRRRIAWQRWRGQSRPRCICSRSKRCQVPAKREEASGKARAVPSQSLSKKFPCKSVDRVASTCLPFPFPRSKIQILVMDHQLASPSRSGRARICQNRQIRVSWMRNYKWKQPLSKTKPWTKHHRKSTFRTYKRDQSLL